MQKNKVRFSPTRILIGVSLCLGSLVSMPMPAAAACQAGDAGCVLPVGETPPPVVQQQRQPPPIIEERTRGGFGWIAILAALAALAALILLVLNNDDEERPVSP